MTESALGGPLSGKPLFPKEDPPKTSPNCLTTYGTSSSTPQTTSTCSSETGNKFCFVNYMFEKKN